MTEYDDVTDCPICPQLATDRDDALREVAALTDELERLRQWKAEAMTVLAAWEDVWIVAGRPGELGRSKAAGVMSEVERLRTECDEWKTIVETTLMTPEQVQEWCRDIIRRAEERPQ